MNPFPGHSPLDSASDFARAARESHHGWQPAGRALHLFTLSAFAVAQPVYDRAAERIGYLQDRGIQIGALLALVGLLSVLVPLAFFSIEFCARRLSQRTGHLVSSVISYLLFTAILLPWFKRLTFLPGFVILALGLAAGVAATWSYFRFIRMRQTIAFSAVGVLFFPCWFLFFSAARTIALPPPDSRVHAEDPIPVVMVVLDEFCGESLMNENREIDPVRFPGFAELSRCTTWFRNATSVRPMTDHAVPALLSGKYQKNTVRPEVSEYPQNLFSLIRNSEQYELVAFEPISRLCSLNERQDQPPQDGPLAQLADIMPSLALVYAYHLYPYENAGELPAIPRIWFRLADWRSPDRSRRRGVLRYKWGDNRNSQFNHFLDCLAPAQTHALYFCHLMLPHVPWCYLPSGRRYAEDGPDWGLLELDTTKGIDSDWPDDELYVVHHQLRYLLQLQFADRLMRRLLDRLHQTGLFDRCLLIVVGDHGTSFRTQEARRWLDQGNLRDIMPIPLFVKRPYQTVPAVSDRNVESIDILPTIADVLEMPLPRSVDGSSIFDDSRPERPLKTMNDSSGTFTADAHPQWIGSAMNLQLSRFGSGKTRPNGFFETGPHPELIGRRADELMTAASGSVEIELLNFRDVYSPHDDSLVPCFFEGRVHGATAFPTELAVAVNGTIQAVTRTYLAGESRITWSAMVPETCLRPGKNDIAIYVVSSSERGLSLWKPAVRRAISRAASAKAP